MLHLVGDNRRVWRLCAPTGLLLAFTRHPSLERLRAELAGA